LSQRPGTRPTASWSVSLQRRAYFAAGTFLRYLKIDLADFSEEGLLAAARRYTGLSDFGDPGFRTALAVLTQSTRTEAKLSFEQSVGERFWLIEVLKRRLHIQKDLLQHPEILQERIASPLFILGMPRSGTTLLQNLLHADAGARWLRPWELEEPWPKAEGPDPRERSFLRRLEQSRSGLNEMDKIHALDSPADCDLLFLPTFYANLQTVSLHIPSYNRWLEERTEKEWEGPYAYYRTELQRLQWHRPVQGHWALKSPLHLGHIPALLATFPDARLIHLHRDPRKAVASTCSMVLTQRQQKTAKVDRAEIGRFISERLANRVERAMSARQSVPAGQIVDVQYADLLRSPKETVQRIYEHFGMSVGPEMMQGLDDHLRENPQHKRGVHQYGLDQFGLSAEEIDRLFAYYRSAYQVPVEGAARA
jgi:hypothetical protein